MAKHSAASYYRLNLEQAAPAGSLSLSLSEFLQLKAFSLYIYFGNRGGPCGQMSFQSHQTLWCHRAENRNGKRVLLSLTVTTLLFFFPSLKANCALIKDSGGTSPCCISVLSLAHAENDPGGYSVMRKFRGTQPTVPDVLRKLC